MSRGNGARRGPVFAPGCVRVMRGAVECGLAGGAGRSHGGGHAGVAERFGVGRCP